MKWIAFVLAVMASVLVLSSGLAFAQSFIGDSDDNRLVGTNQADFLSGLGGDDTLYGKERNDELRGREGNDTLFGGTGNDILSGGPGNDVLYAQGGGDRLRGGTGNDEVNGGLGNDVLYLKDGETDVGNCGPGNDTVVTYETSPPFDEAAPGTGPNGDCENIAQPIPTGP